MRSTIVMSARPRGLITVMVAATMPANALLDSQGNPILDDQGNFILTST